jgi:hypothetical protein
MLKRIQRRSLVEAAKPPFLENDSPILSCPGDHATGRESDEATT